MAKVSEVLIIGSFVKIEDIYYRDITAKYCLCMLGPSSNLMQMSENNRFSSFALDSAHVKFDV